MSKKNKDEFDEFDDEDFQFDDLDGFDSDIDTDSGTEIPIDSTSERTPISKSRAIFDKVRPALAGVGRAAVSRLTRRVSDEFPETSSLVDEGLNIATDVVRLKNEFTKDIEPTVNQLKTVGRRLAPRIQPMVPKSAYDKLMSKLEPTDYGGKDVSLGSQRDEALAESMRTVFAATMEADNRKQKESAINTFIDRKLTASRHTELSSLVGDIRAVSLNQYAFNQKVNIPYMKKMLELKYQHIWVSKDILKVLTTYSETSQGKLEEIRHNTALPDSQKEFLSEKYKDKMRERIVTSIGDYVSEFGKNVLTNLQEQVLGPGKSILETLGDVGEQFVTGMEMEDEMLEMEGKKRPSVKQGIISNGSSAVAKWLAGLGGGAVGNAISEKLDPYRDDILNFTGNTKTNTAFMINRLRGNMTDSDNGLLNALGNLIPELDKSAGRIKNTAFSGAMEPTAFDMATRTSIVEVIPSLLAGIFKQITELNTGKPAPEYTYDFKQRKMVTVDDFTSSMEKDIFGTKEARTEALRTGIAPLRAQLKRVGHTEAVATFDAVADEVATVFYNLAQWKDYPILQPEEFRAYDSDPSQEPTGYIKHALKGVKHPQAVVELIVTALYKTDGTLNRSTYLAWTRAIQRYMTEYSERYKRLLGGYIDTGAVRHMGGIFTDQQDTDDLVVDADKLRDRFTTIDGTALRDTTESDEIASRLIDRDTLRAMSTQTLNNGGISDSTSSQSGVLGYPTGDIKASALKHKDALFAALHKEQTAIQDVLQKGKQSKWYRLFSKKVTSTADTLRTRAAEAASAVTTPGYTGIDFPSTMPSIPTGSMSSVLLQTPSSITKAEVSSDTVPILETIASHTALMVTSLKEISAHTEAGVYVTAGTTIPESRRSFLGKIVSAPWTLAKWGVGTAATVATSPFRLMGKLFGKSTQSKKGYVDVYRQDELDTPLVTVKQLKKGLCYQDGSPVTDSYSIDRPVYNPYRDINDNPRKPSAQSEPLCVITQEDIDAGLVDKNNIRLQKAGGARGTSGDKGFIRRTVGGLFSTAGTAAKGVLSVEWAIAKSVGSTALGATKRLLFPYCDVYTRDPSGQFILLCRGGDLKKFGVYSDGKRVRSSYEITGPVHHLLTNDLIISPQDIAQGLYNGSGESLSNAGSVLGNMVALGARTALGAAKLALKLPVGMAKIGISAVKRLIKGKNPYVDVFKKGAIDPEHPLLRGEGIRRGLYCYSNGERVTSAYTITEPVYEVNGDEVGNCLITNEDLVTGLVNVHDEKLSAWNGRSTLGKVASLATGAASWMLNTTAGIGRGILSGVSSLFTGLFGGVFSADGKLQLANRTDIKELVGDKLDVIIAMLDQRLELPEQKLIDRDGYTKLGTIEEARAIKDGRIAIPGGKDDPDSIFGPNADLVREETEEEAEIQENVAMRVREKERKLLAKKGLDRNGQYLRKGGGDGEGEEEGGILSSIAGLLWTMVKGMGYTAIAMKIPEIWDASKNAVSWIKDTNLTKNIKTNIVNPFASTKTGAAITNTVGDLATSTARVGQGAVDIWRNSGLYKGLKFADKAGNMASKGTLALLGLDTYMHLDSAEELEKVGEYKRAAAERGSAYGGIAGAAAGGWMLRGNGMFRLAGMAGGYYAGGALGETIMSAYGSGYEKFAVGESSTGKNKLQFTLFNLRNAAYGTTENRNCTEELVDQLELLAYQSFLTREPLSDEAIRDIAVAMDILDKKHPTASIRYWRKWWSERFLPVYFIYLSALEMAGVTMESINDMTQEQCTTAFNVMETNYTKNPKLNQQQWLTPTMEGYKKYARGVEAGIYEEAAIDETYAHDMVAKGIEDPNSIISGKNVAIAATTGYIARYTKFGKQLTNKAGSFIAEKGVDLLNKSAAGRTLTAKAGDVLSTVANSKLAKGTGMLSKYGGKLLKAGPMSVLLQGGIAGLDIKEELDKGRTDLAVQRGIEATASITGGLMGASHGAAIGAGIGAGIGAFFGGVGAIPGAWIGGLLGSVAGGYYGATTAEGLISPLAKRMGAWFTDDSGPGMWGKPRFQWGCFKFRAQLYGIEHPENFESIIDRLEEKAYDLISTAETGAEAKGLVDSAMDWFSGKSADLELMDVATALGIDVYKYPKEAVSFINAWYRLRFLPVFFDYLTLLKNLEIPFNRQEDIDEEQAGIILNKLDEVTAARVEPMTNLVPTDDAFKKWVAFTQSPEGQKTTFTPDTEKARAALATAMEQNGVATLGDSTQQLSQNDYIVAMNFAGKIKEENKAEESASDAAHQAALIEKYGPDYNKSALEKTADSLGVTAALDTTKELAKKGLDEAKAIVDNPSQLTEKVKAATTSLTDGTAVTTVKDKAATLYASTTEKLNQLVEGKDLSLLNESQKTRLIQLKEDLVTTGKQLLEDPEKALGTLGALGGTLAVLGKDMGTSAMDSASALVMASQAKLSPQFDKLLAGGAALLATGAAAITGSGDDTTDRTGIVDTFREKATAVKSAVVESKDALLASPMWAQATAAIAAIPPMEEAKSWLMTKAQVLEDKAMQLYTTGKQWLLPEDPQQAVNFLSRITTALLDNVDTIKREGILSYLKQPGGFCDTLLSLQDKILKGEPVDTARHLLDQYLPVLQMYIADCMQMDLPTFCKQYIKEDTDYMQDPDGADRGFLDRFGLSYAAYDFMDRVYGFSQTVKQQAKDVLDTISRKDKQGLLIEATAFGKDALTGLMATGSSLLHGDGVRQLWDKASFRTGLYLDDHPELKRVIDTTTEKWDTVSLTARDTYTAVASTVGTSTVTLKDTTKDLFAQIGAATNTLLANGLRFDFKSAAQATMDSIKTKLENIPDLADVQDWFTGMKDSLASLSPQEWGLYRLRCFLYGIPEYENSQGIISRLEEITLSFFEKIRLPKDGTEETGYLDRCLSKFHEICGFDNPQALDTLLLGFAYSFGLDAKDKTKEAIHFMKTWYLERFIPSLRLVEGTLASLGTSILSVVNLGIEQCAAVIKQLKDFATQNNKKMEGLTLSSAAFITWCQETYGKLTGDLTPGIEKAYAAIDGMRQGLSESARDLYDSLKDTKLKNVIDGIATVTKPLTASTAHAFVPSASNMMSSSLSPGQQAAVGATASSVGRYVQSGTSDVPGVDGAPSPSVNISGLKHKGLGSVTAIFESNGNSAAIAWDSTGGTSYGKYQFGSRPGGLAAFIRWAMTVPEGKALATRMISAIGPLAATSRGDAGWGDTGSKRGAAVEAWKAAVAAGEVGDLEDRYFSELVLPRALNTLSKENPVAARLIQPSRALMEMFHSLNIQHGEGGARRVLGAAVKRLGARAETATPDDLVNAVYDIRGNYFGSSKPSIQQAARNRFRKERPIILSLLKEEKEGTTTEETTTTDSLQSPSTNTTQATAVQSGMEGGQDGAISTPPVSQQGSVSTAQSASAALGSAATEGIADTPQATADPVGPEEGEEGFKKLKLQPGVETSGLLPAMKSALGKLNAEFMEMFGSPLTVKSGSRTLEKQAQLYRTYGPRRAAAPSPTAPHIAGFAADLDENQASKADSAGLLKKYGLWRPFWPKGKGRTDAEEWHTELSGVRGRDYSVDANALNELPGGKEPTDEELQNKPTVTTPTMVAQDLKSSDAVTQSSASAMMSDITAPSQTAAYTQSPMTPDTYVSTDTAAQTPQSQMPSLTTPQSNDTVVSLLQMQLEQAKLMATSLAAINTSVTTIAQRAPVAPTGNPQVQPVELPAAPAPLPPTQTTQTTGTQSQAMRTGPSPVSVAMKTYR